MIIITENEKMAQAVRFAYVKGKESGPLIINGEESAVYWHKGALLKDLAEPGTSDFETVIQDDCLKKIEELIAKTGSDKIIIALYPTRTATLFTDLLATKLAARNIAVTSTSFSTLRKKDIKSSLNTATIPHSRLAAEVLHTKTRKNIAAAVAKTVRKMTDEKMSTDINSLCLLYLIDSREKRIGSPSVRFTASIAVSGRTVTAKSLFSYTQSEADALKERLGAAVEYKENILHPYPTAAELYTFYDHCEFSDRENNIRGLSEELFNGRFISCPYTMAQELPANLNSENAAKLLEVCSDIFPLAFTDEDVQVVINSTKAPASCPHAIIPLKRNTEGLTDPAGRLYAHIAFLLAEAVRENNVEKLLFHDTASGVPFTADARSEITIGPRGNKAFSCMYSREEEGTFKRYTPYELISELTLRGLSAGDVVLSILDKAVSDGIIYVDNAGVHLSAKGNELLSLLPMDAKEVIGLFESVEKAFGDEGGESAMEIYPAIKKQLENWIDRSGPLRKAKADVCPPVITESSEPSEKPSAVSAAKEPSAPDKKEKSVSERFSLDDIFKDTQEEEPETQEKSNDGLKNENGHAKENEENAPSFSGGNAVQKSDPASGRAPSCPFCKGGSMHETATSFVCDECGSFIDKAFTFEEAVFSLTEKDISALCKKGRTKLKIGKCADGSAEGAFIILSGSSLTATHKSSNLCPRCGSFLEVYAWGYSCPDCSFAVPFKAYNKRLSAEELKALLKGTRTEPVSGLISKDGEMFSARLFISADGKLHLYK